MTSQIHDDVFGHAFLCSVRDGAYPEVEEVISAECPPSAVLPTLELLEKAREETKTYIRQVSQESSSDIDGWISQAKQLRGDIRASQTTAQEIVDQAKTRERLQAEIQDAASKVHLLDGEVSFNEKLEGVLQQVRRVISCLASAQGAALNDKLVESVDLLDIASIDLRSLRARNNSKIAGLLETKASSLRKDLLDIVAECWDALIHINLNSKVITIKREVQRSITVQTQDVFVALSKLDIHVDRINKFSKDLEAVILTPRLKPWSDGSVGSIHVEGDSLSLAGRSLDVAVDTLFQDVNIIIEYLSTHLPRSISVPLSKALMPNLIATIISDWLYSLVPSDLKGLQDFQRILAMASDFAKSIAAYEWEGSNELVTWIQVALKIWLEKRRDTSLDQVRQLLARGLGMRRTVERIETRAVIRDDDIFTPKMNDDDWNAGWSDDEETDARSSEVTNAPRRREEEEEEEEVVGTWGFEDEVSKEYQKDRYKSTGSDEESDAWGWGEDADKIETAEHPEHQPMKRTRDFKNATSVVSKPAKREITLKELYDVTELPHQILTMIEGLINDAKALAQPVHASLPVVLAAAGLLTLPALMLAMYRASAPNYYSRDSCGSMFLYNDSLRIAEQLRTMNGDQRLRATMRHLQLAAASDLTTEISAMETFGKRAYGKEMELQRTILRDLLDGAQGFTHCTEPPFAQECDIAIGSVVDRIRDVHKQWRTVLSHSALLQSLGSLLSTVCNKIIVNVEDINDISEAESQRLVSFCNQIASLEDMFTPDESQLAAQQGEQVVVALTAVYTHNWLKFQYLSNILESSLADIIYLWTEGELRIEFEAHELIDLIEALFADSEHRRKAIGEIRRSSFRT